jgi:hypothetical protein
MGVSYIGYTVTFCRLIMLHIYKLNSHGKFKNNGSIEIHAFWHTCGLPSYNNPAKTNNSDLGAILPSCLVSKLQKYFLPRLTPRILFQSFDLSEISSWFQGISWGELVYSFLSCKQIYIHTSTVSVIYIGHNLPFSGHVTTSLPFSSEWMIHLVIL